MVRFLALDGGLLDDPYNERESDMKGNVAEDDKRTFDETAPCPFDLGSHDYSRGRGARPCDTCPRLDAEYAAAGHVWRTRRRDHRDVVIKIAVDRLVVYLAFSRPGSDAPVQGFDIGHVARETVLVAGSWRPIGHLDVCVAR